jgi:hypothetical protein
MTHAAYIRGRDGVFRFEDGEEEFAYSVYVSGDRGVLDESFFVVGDTGVVFSDAVNETRGELDRFERCLKWRFGIRTGAIADDVVK